MATTTKTFAAAGSWICPPGVTSIQVAAQGGGGAGGQRTSNGGGGGGGGGEYAKETAVTVTPGTTYAVTVGVAGATGNPGTNGGNSTFIGDNVTITANGGKTVPQNTLTGGAGGTGSANTTHHNGGAGFTSAGTTGGGGGSAASDTNVGVTATSATGAASPAGAANNFGGAGGTGSTTNNTGGSAPANPAGGGGGGADRSSAGTVTGGAGQAGQIILTYTTPLVGSLEDLFRAASLNTNLWSQFAGGSASFTYATPNAQVNFPATTSSSTDGDITTIENYDLTGSSIIMNVLGISGAGATHTDCELRLKLNASNYIEWQYEAGTLFAHNNIANSNTAVTSFSFDAAAHAWWRIRESGGTIFWDTSSDGITWTNRGSAAAGFAVTSLQILIGGTCFGVDTSPTPFKFANLNAATPLGKDIANGNNNLGFIGNQAVTRAGYW